MKKFILIIFLIFITENFLFSKNFVFVDYYPNIDPIKKFENKFVHNMNKYSNEYEFICIKNKNIFKSSYEILDAIQSNLIQFAILPAYIVNNRFNMVLKDLYSFNYIDPESIIIPLREKLMNYGLFLLDVFFAGKYSIYSKLKLNKKENLNKVSFGYIVNTKEIENFFNQKFKTTVFINMIEDIPRLVKSDIINTVLLTPIQFYRSNLLNQSFHYQNRMKFLSEYYIILVNNSFWDNIKFDEKSIIWNFISTNKENFKINFSKYYVYIENEIFKKINSSY